MHTCIHIQSNGRARAYKRPQRGACMHIYIRICICICIYACMCTQACPRVRKTPTGRQKMGTTKHPCAQEGAGGRLDARESSCLRASGEDPGAAAAELVEAVDAVCVCVCMCVCVFLCVCVCFRRCLVCVCLCVCFRRSLCPSFFLSLSLSWGLSCSLFLSLSLPPSLLAYVCVHVMYTYNHMQ